MLRLLLLCIPILVVSCAAPSEKTGSAATQAEPQSRPPVSAGEQEAASAAACKQDAEILLGGPRGEVIMEVISALAVQRINLNEQTDAGSVAKPGWTICLSNFELPDEDPWLRPDSSQLKVELRLFTGDRSDVQPGTYRSPFQSHLQAAPMLYMAGKTVAVAFPKIGKVELLEISDEYVCGSMNVQTMTGLKLKGNFKARIVTEDSDYRPAG